MSFHIITSDSDWTLETTPFQAKPSSLKNLIQELALFSTRSNTQGDQSPDNISSDASSDQETTGKPLALSRKAKSLPETLSRVDSSEDLSNFEIDVCPKRKKFNTIEERRLFVEEYKRKYKTELCKNWELKKTCKFGDKCCFAHGRHELKSKTSIHTKYKTKPCKQYHQSGYCPYGQRCQYLHKEAVQPNIFFTPCQAQAREGYTYETLQEINQLCGIESEITTIFAKLPNRPRLGIFQRLASSEP